jgi:hypothetical protein
MDEDEDVESTVDLHAVGGELSAERFPAQCTGCEKPLRDARSPMTARTRSAVGAKRRGTHHA